MPYNPVSLANLRPFEKGNIGGVRAAGASIREHWNRLSALCDDGKLTYDDIRTLAKKSPNPNERAAAIQVLRAAENPDPADFDGLISGTKSLVEYAADGIDTSVIRKIQTRSKMEPGEDGEKELVIERTIEFHDRAGASIDRVINHTDGMPVARSITADVGKRDVGATGIDYSLLTDDELARLRQLAVSVRARLGLDRQDNTASRG